MLLYIKVWQNTHLGEVFPKQLFPKFFRGFVIVLWNLVFPEKSEPTLISVPTIFPLLSALKLSSSFFSFIYLSIYLSFFKYQKKKNLPGCVWCWDACLAVISKIFSLTVKLTNIYLVSLLWQTGFPGGAGGKELTCQCRRHKRHKFSPWNRKIPWIHSSILAWRIPLTEEPGRLQSMGSQRVGHKWSNLACIWQILHYVFMKKLQLSPFHEASFLLLFHKAWQFFEFCFIVSSKSSSG